MHLLHSLRAQVTEARKLLGQELLMPIFVVSPGLDPGVYVLVD